MASRCRAPAHARARAGVKSLWRESTHARVHAQVEGLGLPHLRLESVGHNEVDAAREAERAALCVVKGQHVLQRLGERREHVFAGLLRVEERKAEAVSKSGVLTTPHSPVFVHHLYCLLVFVNHLYCLFVVTV